MIEYHKISKPDALWLANSKITNEGDAKVIIQSLVVR